MASSFTKPAAYSSAYASGIANALKNIQNTQAFNYDPLQDANYQQYAKVYNANGIKAQEDTLGQAAALNGGYGSSYAVSAAQQARNEYNQQLAALIPELEQNAYQRYYDNYNMNVSTLGALQDAESQAYQQYRDKVSDYQWQKEYNLSKSRAGSSGGGGSSGSGYVSSYGGKQNQTVKGLYSGNNDPSGQVGKGAVSATHKATGKTSDYYGSGKYKTSTNKSTTKNTTKYRAVGKTAVRTK